MQICFQRAAACIFPAPWGRKRLVGDSCLLAGSLGAGPRCVPASLTSAPSTYLCFSSLLCILLCLSVRIRTGHFWGPVT